ncbi:MAG: ATP-binding protein, partial [Phaeodactylibacter sp.]|nr:ATP-binding protein [Phaeodactylibacter sp.]
LKFHNGTFEITKKYAEQLQKKVQAFKEGTRTKKNVFLTFLTAYGVKKNKYYLSLAANQLLVEDLFERVKAIG